MSEKIDYDAYLKQINLADITTKQEDKIKQYLEEQCKTDDALKAVYNPEKIKDCYNFIFECAKKVAHGNSSVIEDAVVYKMARDYYLEILPNLKEEPVEKTEEKPVDITTAQETVKEVAEQVEADAAADKEKRDYCGFEVFGEETDEPEEAEAEQPEEPCDQDEVGEEPEKEPVMVEAGKSEADPIRYDEDGQALLFDFM